RNSLQLCCSAPPFLRSGDRRSIGILDQRYHQLHRVKRLNDRGRMKGIEVLKWLGISWLEAGKRAHPALMGSDIKVVEGLGCCLLLILECISDTAQHRSAPVEIVVELGDRGYCITRLATPK